tara:strand:+ start:298 stop:537 length:240 start_codon:yes stop_codon:yes gene_type:complete
MYFEKKSLKSLLWTPRFLIRFIIDNLNALKHAKTKKNPPKLKHKHTKTSTKPKVFHIIHPHLPAEFEVLVCGADLEDTF